MTRTARAVTSSLPDPATSRAVIIGSSAYRYLDQLPAVEANLRDLAGALRDPLLWGLPEQHCTIVANPADASAMLDPVRQAGGEATDTLIVYFAGHGLRDADSADLYLALGSSRENVGYSAVAYDHIRAEVRAAGAARKIVVLDCCFSGRAARTLGGSEALAAQAAVDGAYVLTASPPSRVALSPEGETYTAFTGELLQLLRGGLADGPELIDLDTLYRVLFERLTAKNRPVPQRSQENNIGRLPLVRNKARSLDPPAAAGPVLDADVRAAMRVAGLNLSRRLRAAGRSWDAIPVLRLTLQESQAEGDGSALAAQQELSELLYETGNLGEAVDVLEQAFHHTQAVLSPEAIQVCRRLAGLLQESGNHIQACEVLNHVLDRLDNGIV
jgi:tetratricopeptide (TPR) repeat protein